MKTLKIKKYNSQVFIDDLKRAKGVMVYTEKTDAYFPIAKKDLVSEAEIKHIDYFMSEILGSPGKYQMIVL